MARDPLYSLVRLRRLAVDEARGALADCLRGEEAAEAVVARIAASIERETDVATSLSTSDAEVEAFAAWLRRIRPEQHAAHAAQDQAAIETARARAIVAVARAALQAAEDMVERHEAERRAEAERQAQRDLDEVAAHVHQP
jgi:flagellar export protein FliJ